MAPNRRPSLAPAEEAQTVYLGKNVGKASPWKQRVGRGVNICSSLRISWGIEVLTILSWQVPWRGGRTPWTPASWKCPESPEA